MPEVSIKFFMPLKVAFAEKKAPREEMGKVVDQISRFLTEKKVKLAGNPIALLEEGATGPGVQKANVEVCLPISGKVKGGGEIKGKELDKGAYACIEHSGPLENLPDTYQMILNWIRENGYRIVGPNREAYQNPITGGQPRQYLIELQFPVRKG